MVLGDLIVLSGEDDILSIILVFEFYRLKKWWMFEIVSMVIRGEEMVFLVSKFLILMMIKVLLVLIKIVVDLWFKV